ncbi:MAG: TrkA family potassium uptake protein [Bacilli bacterium]|jgi:trk system potassium uptake protein TrkA|nr:TrkA family potassium uptake protein [Bacilli bacterium]
MRKIIAVIGLGRFGLGLVKALSTKDVDVIALDKDKNNVAKVGDFIENAVICDSTNVDSLQEAGLADADNAIIAFGQDTQANIATTILTVVALKKIGVKKITCRIDDASYEDLLLRVGADAVISPFDIASESLALKVSSKSVMDYYHISQGYDVFEIEIKKEVKPIALMELNSPTRFGVNIILYTRDRKTTTPTRDYVLMPGDHIFAFGMEKGVYQLVNYLSERDEEENK